MTIIVADRYMTLDSVKPDKDCTQGCDIHNDYTCFECEDIQIRKVYPNAIYNEDCEWEIEETMLKGNMKDENKPKKFIVEFTTKTHPAVVKQDFEKINKFIQENVGNITEKITIYKKITTTRLNKFFKKSTTEDDKGLIEYLVVNALYEKGENPIPKNHVNYKYLTKSSYSLKNVETKDLKDLYKKIIIKEG